MIGPADNSATTRPAETAETGPAIASIAPTLASIATTPKPPPSPDRLLGMSGPTVAGLLGPAKLVRRDGDAEIWQYRNDHCVLDVFLYGPGPLSVAHVDLRKRRRGTRDKNVCYAELARKANAGR